MGEKLISKTSNKSPKIDKDAQTFPENAQEFPFSKINFFQFNLNLNSFPIHGISILVSKFKHIYCEKRLPSQQVAHWKKIHSNVLSA